MIVAELIQTALELDQKSEVIFVKRDDSPYIYLISSLPDGKHVACELPTAIQKEKQNDSA